MVYLDHNATGPLLPEARRVWVETAETFIGNPSSPHRLGSRAEAALNDARAALAGVLGCDPLDLIWTSGATESNNTVLHHVACQAGADAEVWVAAIEHPCVLAAARHYFPQRHRLIPVCRSGVVDLDWLRRELVRARPALVAVMAANNETGVLQPWREVRALCRERGVPFFCDAVQWIGRLPAHGLGDCDFVSGCAHKCGGPRGVGFLKCPAQGRVEPLLRGGPQEEGRRAGTENVAGAAALVAALKVRETAMIAEPPQMRLAWRCDFEEGLLADLPGAEVVGRSESRLWNTVSALMPEVDCQQRWVVKLDKLGFAVSTGSACASGREKPSHVLAAMGYGTSETRRVLRFSSGWDTTPDHWRAANRALRKIQQALGRAGTG